MRYAIGTPLVCYKEFNFIETILGVILKNNMINGEEHYYVEWADGQSNWYPHSLIEYYTKNTKAVMDGV